MSDDDAFVRAATLLSRELGDGATALDPLVELARDATCVFLGEATHGTHEFYRIRAELTQRLIEEAGFSAVAVEADWPEACRVNRYVRGVSNDRDAEAALSGFRRFPAWLWRNAEVLAFVRWLRAWNDRREPRTKAGFYGLDLYSLHASIDAVLSYLDRTDAPLARRARQRYACFEQFERNPESYGYSASLGLSPDCEREVLAQLLELQRQRSELLRGDGLAAEDELFAAEQNARVVSRAEKYYRTLLGSRIATWNQRDTHMADTLGALLEHLEHRSPQPKVIVWAHNSHVGDARFTDPGLQGELNLGQLARERYGAEAVSIGFTTHAGTVTAASDWGAAPERMHLRAALPQSSEELLHRVGSAPFFLRFRGLEDAAERAVFDAPRLERAVGVVYKPHAERTSHYYYVRLLRQFDALVHVDETRALEPLERDAAWASRELPETYPTGV